MEENSNNLENDQNINSENLDNKNDVASDGNTELKNNKTIGNSPSWQQLISEEQKLKVHRRKRAVLRAFMMSIFAVVATIVILGVVTFHKENPNALANVTVKSSVYKNQEVKNWVRSDYTFSFGDASQKLDARPVIFNIDMGECTVIEYTVKNVGASSIFYLIELNNLVNENCLISLDINNEHKGVFGGYQIANTLKKNETDNLKITISIDDMGKDANLSTNFSLMLVISEG